MAGAILEGYAMFAACHFASPILEIGCNLVVSSACCNDPRSSSGFRQRANAVLIATRRQLSRVLQCVHHWPLTTTTNDERHKTGANRARMYMGARKNMPPLRPPVGGYRPRGVARDARPVAEGSSCGGALLRAAARLITLDYVLRKGTQSNWRGKQARICCVLCDAFCPTHHTQHGAE